MAGRQCGLEADTGLHRAAFVDTVPPPAHLNDGKDKTMAKAYWVATYRSIKNPDALAAYAKLGAPAIQAGGGRFLARGNPAQVYEAGIAQRVVLIEFDSVQQAKAVHDSPGYQEALRVLGNGAERDIRIVEGV